LIFYLNQRECAYCHKFFSRKNSVIYHIKHNCKIKKNIEKEKYEIFKKLKLDEEKKILKLGELEQEKKK
jgi:hypothetical protein